MAHQDRRLLIVDDDPAMRRSFQALLRRDYQVRDVASGEEALALIELWPVDLVLMDIVLPGIDGHQTCRRIKSSKSGLRPQVIMVSGKSSPREQKKAFEVGADDFLVKPVDPSELRSRVELHFRLLDSQETTAELQDEVNSHHPVRRQVAEEQTEQIVATQDVAVFALAKVAESRDYETGQHIVRLREYAQRLAQELQNEGPYKDLIDDRFLSDLYRSSPLHDIGKVGILDAVLLKPARLTKEEFEVMKTHTVIGGDILHEAVLQLKGGSFLAMAAMIAQCHHERWDGTGYMAGLVGEEIPLPARIVSVADVYDALTSVRPYKEAWSTELAKSTIDEGAGSQFDPVVVDAFNRCFVDILKI